MSTTITRSVPVQSDERIQVVDVLRGFAILGILLFNMKSFSGQSFFAGNYPLLLDKITFILIDFFVQAKFYSLFSFLFGWGMAVQMRRAEQKGTNFLPAYFRRLLILLLFGVLHTVFLWPGDILLMYAILGLMLLGIFRNSNPRTLLIAAGLLLLSRILLTLPGAALDSTRELCLTVSNCLTPENALSQELYTTGTYWEVTQLRFQELGSGLFWFPCFLGPVFAMMLLGLYTGKRKLFADFDRHQTLFRRIMWIGLVVGVILNGIFTYVSTVPFQSPYFSLIRVGSRTLGAPALTLFYISGITLLYQKSAWRERLLPLGRAGRMALTNYISHSLFLTFFFYGYGLGLYGITKPTFGLIFTIIIYRTQLQFSKWWFEHYKYGPLEWVWRRLAYNIRLPFSVTSDRDYIEISSSQAKRRRMILIGVGLLLSIPLALLLINQTEDPPQVASTPVPTQVDSPAQVEEQAELPPESLMSDGFQLALSGMGQPVRDRSGDLRDLMDLIEGFDADLALEIIGDLEADLYQGRYSGTPGGLAAAEYLAGRFKDYGLFPVGESGDYFQTFPVNGVVLGALPALEVTSSDGFVNQGYGLHQDYKPVLGHYAGRGSGEGKVIWVVDCADSDFSDLDLVGQIVFCKANDVEDQARRAAKNGAAGLLLLADELAQPPATRSALTESWVPDPLPVFLVYDQTASDLLDGSGYSIRDLSILYEPLTLETSVRMESTAAAACGAGDCAGRNILGVFPGWDPAYKNQVIIFSANYDGLGSSPDGQVWPGANWNGSGVGVLLEIANSWHESDYLPRATVLFALWDAEEQNSLGVEYFLQNPIFPLENTLAVIHLSGVGAGSDQLLVRGTGLGEQIEAAAATFGLEISQADTSDRITSLFQSAQLPNISLSWEGSENLAERPEDTLDVIQPEKLHQAEQVAEYFALRAGDISPQVSDLLALRCEALVENDLTAFLQTATPASMAGESRWFAEIQSLEPSDCSAAVDELLVYGKTASVGLEIQLLYLSEEGEEEETLEIQQRAKLDFGPAGWLWDGPDQITAEKINLGNTSLQVHYHQDISEQVAQIGEFAVQEYSRITEMLSLPSQLDGHLYLYPTRDLLKADTIPTAPGTYPQWIAIDTLKFSGNPLSDLENYRAAIMGLILENQGISNTSFPWLWEGLPQLLAEGQEGILIESDRLDRFRDQLSEGDIPSTRLGSWAAVEYLRQTVGWRGLGQLISGLGAACREDSCADELGLDQALISVLGLDQEAFQSSLADFWLGFLDQAQADIDANLDQRTLAVLEGDLLSFLDTVDPGIPNLLAEEEHWFAANSQFPLETFRLTAKPITLYEDGSMFAAMTMEFKLEGVSGSQGRGSIPVDVLFTVGDEGLLWAGPILEKAEHGLVEVRYPADAEEQALQLLEKAAVYYLDLSEALGITDPEVLTINLYESKPVYERFISLSHDGPDWDPGWSKAGHSVKFLLGDGLEDDFILVRHISRSLLSQLAVEDEWLLNGGSLYLARDAADSILQDRAAASLISLSNTIIREKEFQIDQYPDLYQLSEYEYRVALTQAWDTIRYLVERFGEDAFSELLDSSSRGTDLNAAVQSAIGLSLEEFSLGWKESLGRGHILSSTLETSQRFDADQAQDHIDYLTSPELAGRQAGSPGSGLAAAYIREKFEAYGLSVEEQFFPVPYQTYLDRPVLEFWINGKLEEFSFREDFLVLKAEDLPAGISGELIWISDRDYTGMDLTGKIAIRTPNQAVEREIQNARDRGALALILVGDKNRDEDLLARYPLYPNSPQDGFPVLELTRSGFARLMELTGLTKAILDFSKPAVWMDVQAALSMSLSSAAVQETSNVIGYLPGADPKLRDEFIIIGAHYDHVGDELGTAYRGANDNASGVGLMLEIARLWQAADYQPQRSVLFIAWGGQELGEMGSAYYLANPLYPLEGTIASLQLDGVGNGDGYYLDAYGDREKDGLLIFNIQKASEELETRLLITGPDTIVEHSPDWLFSPTFLFNSTRLEPTSDARPFRLAGIPTLLLRWRDTSEKNLPDSAAYDVLLDRLGSSGKTISAALMMLAR